MTADVASLYEHCARAIERALPVGAHGLPLMGSGDWNDGMDQIGAKGRGESVWLGFFLYSVLQPFADLADSRADPAFASRCRDAAEALRGHLELSGWDGAWYRRAYSDDGTPLGTATGSECRIDSVSQSWAVLSGAADRYRAETAMASVDEQLVRRGDGLVRLLDPPFDGPGLAPGYVKGYVPGVRENGGQYTHAAVWAAMAHAQLGDARRAWDVWRLINPLSHGASEVAVARYRVEPYVVAADVYAVAPHVGRGGWTWYTGSAAWLYRLIIESLLGLVRTGDRLTVTPTLPAAWAYYALSYRCGNTTYRIDVTQVAGAGGGQETHLDGQRLPDGLVPLVDDALTHLVTVTVMAASG